MSENMLQIAVQAAQQAGAFLRDNVGKIKNIEEKYGQEKNLVTEIDRGSEKIIIDHISKAFPHHTFLGEESGKSATGDAEFVWVIDPLDGTTNYTHGFPVFSVSIALEVRGIVEVGVVYDPNFDEMFTAERGKGAFLNGKRMQVTKTSTIGKSMLVTGFPYNIADNPQHAIEHFINFLKKSQAVRRMGSAAIDLAYVAAGRYEGFWEVALQPWDKAAGELLVLEAGGKVTGFDGGPATIYDEETLASNGAVHQAMLEILKMVKD